jgi:putative pyruvate formate lyase activating enzyme
MKINISELERRTQKAYQILESCTLCPRNCEVNRIEGELGYCQIDAEVRISSFNAHFGEEPPLVGHSGSGTLFFTSCNMGCIFCQNYDISQLRYGEVISIEKLADIMLALQKRGCHNINFVTPTHQAPQILKALVIAYKQGLNIPLVYNCGGYEPVEVLTLLDGIIDIYMPDAKYADEEIAFQLSGIKNYPEVMKRALKEMYRQVGDLQMDENGVASKGLLIRHLVLPNNQAGTAALMKFIARELSRNSYVNIMDQYRPCHKAHKYPKINRRITSEEFAQAIELAKKEGLHRGFEETKVLPWIIKNSW